MASDGCGEPFDASSGAAHDVGSADTSSQTLEWEELQRSLRARLKDRDDDGWSADAVRRVGGLDISFENGTNKGTAVLIVCEFAAEGDQGGKLHLVYEDAIDVNMDLPYVSGFLFVREVPGYSRLLERLRAAAPHLEPDIFLVDGCGMFHPRQLGSASHLGVEQDLRTIGVAKKLMNIGDDFGAEDAQALEALELPDFGSHAEIVGRCTGQVYGAALRTSALSEKKKKQSEVSSRRVYVSIGNRVSLLTAMAVVLRCSDVPGGSYIPEPIRLADLTGRSIERAWQQLHSTSKPEIRQFILDICNLLDDKQRRTCFAMLEERPAEEPLEAIPEEELRRKKATIQEVFNPFRQLCPAVTVGEARVALKLDKPWAVGLAKGALSAQRSGQAMRPPS